MAKEIVKSVSKREEESGISESLLDYGEVRPVQEKSIEMLRVVWTRRTFLFRVATLGLLLATAVAFLIPKEFTSTAELMPPDQSQGMGTAVMAALTTKAAGSLGTLGGQLLGLKTSGDLFIGILQSRTVEDDVITKLNLRKIYGVSRWDSARRQLAANTGLAQDRKSEIITITVTDKSPQRAQQIAQEYIAELNSVVTTLNTSSAHRERVFLEGRLTQVQQDLESAEKEFSQFASKNTAIDIQAQGKAMIEAGANLEGQLIAAQTELEGLRQIFTNNNVRVRETQARIDELNRQIRKLGGKAGAEPSAADQHDAALYPSIRQLPVLGVTYADLYRRMKVQEAVFEVLTQQFELAKVQEAKETPSVKVLDPPDLPERKSFPPHLMIMFTGMVIGLFSGIAWIIGHQVWETTDSADARKMFAAEVWSDVRASLPWTAKNGHTNSHSRGSLGWVRPKNGRGDDARPDDSHDSREQE